MTMTNLCLEKTLSVILSRAVMPGKGKGSVISSVTFIFAGISLVISSVDFIWEGKIPDILSVDLPS